MKMKHYLYVACMFIAALAFTACSDDDDNSVKLANVTLHFNAPSELQSYNPTIGIQELTLKNINTGETTSVVKPGTRVTTSNASITVSVPELQSCRCFVFQILNFRKINGEDFLRIPIILNILTDTMSIH